MQTIYLILFLLIITNNIYSQKEYVLERLEVSEKVAAELETSNSLTKGFTKLSFVGDANIQNSINQGSGISANTGIGLVFNRTWLGNRSALRSLDLGVTINVASTADTLTATFKDDVIANQSDFGTYLLLPNNSKQSGAIEMNLYFNDFNRLKIFRVISGFHFQLIGSTKSWEFIQNDQNNLIDMATLSLRAGPFYEFINDKIRLTKGYSIKVGLTYSTRRILGDLSFSRNNNLKELFLNTTDNSFSGLEFITRFKVRNVVAEFSIPILKGGNDISGLTGSQVITSIKFTGGFPIELKSRSFNDEKFQLTQLGL